MVMVMVVINILRTMLKVMKRMNVVMAMIMIMRIVLCIFDQVTPKHKCISMRYHRMQKLQHEETL